MHCPRRFENPLHPSLYGGEDRWEPRSGYPTCSYCGSLQPEALFSAIAEGCELGPTDKNYKVYVDLPEKNPTALRVTSSTNFDPNDVRYKRVSELAEEEWALVSADDPWLRNSPKDRWVLLEPRGPKVHAKFYFQHFSDDDRGRFVDMLNQKTLNIGYPGYFYRMPYFVGVVR